MEGEGVGVGGEVLLCEGVIGYGYGDVVLGTGYMVRVRLSMGSEIVDTLAVLR